MAKNQATSLNALRDLRGLEVLNAAHNKLAGKVSLGRWTALKAAVLNNNEIESLGGLEKLENLDALILSHNMISSLGGWLAGATALQKISLSCNPLKDLGAVLRGCRALQELRVNNCQLRELPNTLEANSRLRIIEAGNNHMSGFDCVAVLAKLPSLRQLTLKGCPLADAEGYHQHILELAPRLDIMDGRKLNSTKRKAEPRLLGDGAGAPGLEFAPVIDDTLPLTHGNDILSKRQKIRKAPDVTHLEETAQAVGAPTVAPPPVTEVPEADEEDDALDPTTLLSKPKEVERAKKNPQDYQRTGIVKITVGGKRHGVENKKAGKSMTHGSKADKHTTHLRGKGALQILLDEKAADLCGWD